MFAGGVNNSVVGVCGDSAGGRLAATVSHELSNIVHFAVCTKLTLNFKKSHAVTP